MRLAPDRATREQLRTACDAINGDLAIRRRRLVWTAVVTGTLALLVVGVRPEYGALVAGVGLAIVVAIALHTRHTLGREYKMGLALSIVPLLRPGLSFQAHGSIDVREFNALKLFHHSAERVAAEDEIRGTVKGVSFAIQEVKATYTTTTTNGKSTQRRTHTIFDGVAVRLEFNKHFHGHTVVVPEYFGAGFLDGLFGGSLRRVTLENAEFERAFVARSTDDVEARYLLTPRFMEVVLEAGSTLGTDLRLAFRNDTLHLLIPDRSDRFEVSLLRGVSPVTIVAELEEVLALAEQLIGTFDLETRIWTRV